MAQVGWRLSADERLAWAEDGFFIRRRVFREKELVALREAAERVVVRASGAAAQGGTGYEIDGNRYHDVAGATIQYEHVPGSDTVRVLEPFHHLDAHLDRLVDDRRLVEPVRDLVGAERVSLFTDKLNLKRPREGSRFRWHQDSPYWAHFHAELDRLPNVMLALDDAAEENGCLRIIRGSHKRAMLPGLEGQGRLGPLFTDPAHFDEAQQVVAEMPAGSLLFFSPHSVHGSGPNESSSLRRALIFTYQPAGNRMFKIDAEREAVAA